MTAAIRNKELFEKVARSIELAPQSYDQSRWGQSGSCGTKMCIAGWAAYHAGAVAAHRIKRQNGGVDEYWADVITPSGRNQMVMCFARDQLGLTMQESIRLFSDSWLPPIGMTVPDALRAIGSGAEVER